MSPTLLRITVIFLLCSLSACGGDIASEDGTLEQNSGNGIKSAGGAPTVLARAMSASESRGKELYESFEQGCLACHGDDGQSPIFKAISLSASHYQHSAVPGENYGAKEYIEKWMPVADPTICVGECAADIASYLSYIKNPLLELTESPIKSETEAERSVGDSIQINADELPSQLANLMAQGDANCANSCHGAAPGFSRLNLATGSTDQLAARLINQPSSKESCGDELLIDSANPANSLLLKVIDPNNSESLCIAKMPIGSTGVSQQTYSQFAQWVERLIDSQNSLSDSRDNDTSSNVSDIPKEGDGVTVINKVKYLLHGGAVTEQELNQATDSNGQVKNNGLDTVVSQWMQSESFKVKRRTFLELTLQQNPGDLNYVQQFRDTRNFFALPLLMNLEESFIRTAERIANNEEDFRTIMTTRDIEMTTLTVLAYKMADAPKFRNTNSALDSIKTVLQTDIYSTWEEGSSRVLGADANDWRTITLLTNPFSTDMLNAEDFLSTDKAQLFRNIPDGGSMELRAERVGPCTTPAFLQKWVTNQDNQFRVTVNQCLIVGLGQALDASDTTPVNHDFSDIDLESFPRNSECLACHQRLDPMANAFKKNFDTIYHRFTDDTETVGQVDFSFQGYSESVSTLEELNRGIAHHPDFAIGWALKLCEWASSIGCSKTDPKLVTIAAEFEQSGFKLNTLFHEFFTSDFVTQVSDLEDSRLPGAQVSIARHDHFCHAINTRLQQVREANGEEFAEFDVCANETVSGIIPSDAVARGEASFIQPIMPDPFVVKSYEASCNSLAVKLVSSKAGATFDVNDSDQVLDDFTSIILGLPQGTEQYTQARDTLQDLFDVYRKNQVCESPNELESSLAGSKHCGFSLNKHKSLRNIWPMVCASPSVTGVGL